MNPAGNSLYWSGICLPLIPQGSDTQTFLVDLYMYQLRMGWWNTH